MLLNSVPLSAAPDGELMLAMEVMESLLMGERCAGWSRVTMTTYNIQEWSLLVKLNQQNHRTGNET